MIKTAAKRKKSPARPRGFQTVISLNRNPIDRMGSEKLLGQDETIFRKGQRAENIYKIEAGCVRTFIRYGNGRRLVVGLYFAGDYFGLEMHDKYRVSAETVTPTKMLVIGRKALNSRAATNVAVANGMLTLTNLELRRAQQHSLILRLSANERVGQFLFEMKKLNSQNDRRNKKEVNLVMSRQDMADYLNLTIESVARALTQLKNVSAISLSSPRRIAIHIRKPMAA